MGLPQFQDAEVDVQLIGEDGFVVFGENNVGESLPVRSGLIRFLNENGPAITWSEEHTLTDDQALLYQRALNHISKCVIEAQERGESSIPLIESGAFPELFEAFAPGKTLAEVLKPDNAAVWWNVENSLKLWGYEQVLGPSDGAETTMLWAKATAEEAK